MHVGAVVSEVLADDEVGPGRAGCCQLLGFPVIRPVFSQGVIATDTGQLHQKKRKFRSLQSMSPAAHEIVQQARVPLDIRDLRSLVDCIRLVRRTAMQTAVRMITTAVMLALLAGIAIKLKIFGGSP